MIRHFTVVMLSALLIWAGVVTQVAASIIDTREVLVIETRATLVTDVQTQLARQDVQLAMIELGVDPLDAQSRVASLSDQELVELQGQLDAVPAGGSFLAVVGVAFVVLLILELMGVTHVFTSV
jgi:hypothetical protein